MIPKPISNTVSSVANFLANPSFSASNLIAILFVILVVGVVFYGFRRRGV